ncbi:MAG: hypothetical protein ACPGXY_03160 [Alphaproteobacteria bacterium]
MNPDEQFGRTEHHHQRESFVRIKRSFHKLPMLRTFHAIPNGIATTKVARSRASQEGLLAGVPDLHLPYASPLYQYNSLYIEVKCPEHYNHKFGGLTNSQQTLIPLLQQQGNLVVVAYGELSIIDVLENYLDHPLEERHENND